MSEQYLHSDLTRKIIGCAMEVHRTLGNGFQEVIYQRALAIEFARLGLEFSREHEMDIHYKGELIGTSELKLGKQEPADLIQGTPAISDHALFIRSDAFLWKIAETK